jgi:hypothetical protein
VNIKLRQHVGVVLEPSANQFDAGASTFGCMLQGSTDGDYYFYYTGSMSTSWSKASNGVARSRDAMRFVKHDENPVISIGRQSVTPAVFKAHGRYWMVFSSNGLIHRRSLALAVAVQPLGPWKFLSSSCGSKWKALSLSGSINLLYW